MSEQVVGEKVAEAKTKEIERIPVDHSRLLDAITEPYQDKQRRRAISYTTEMKGVTSMYEEFLK